MKNLFIIFTTTAFFISTTKSSKCSTESWKGVLNFDHKKLLGRWFAIERYQNGAHDNSVCLWHDLTFTPNSCNAINEVRNRLFKDGENYKKCQMKGKASLFDPDMQIKEAKLDVEYDDGIDIVKYITALEYNEFALVRACYKGEEYYWTYTRNQYPCEETLDKICQAQDEQGIDKSKLIESCTSVPASAIL